MNAQEEMATPNVIVSQRRATGLSADALKSFGVALAIDSSLGTSVAVTNGSELFTFGVDDYLSHAEVVAALIDQALDAAKLSASQVRSVVAGVGPGPFTGLRVGLAAAQAFAAGCSIPLLPLVSHEAAALEALSALPETEQQAGVFIATDARRKELFGTRYGALDAEGLPVLRGAPALYPRDYSLSREDGILVEPERIDASHLILLAALRSRCHRSFEEPGALYLRSPDVTPQHAPKRVSS